MLLIGLSVFVTAFLAVAGSVGLAQAFLKHQQRQQIRFMLRKAEENPSVTPAAALVRAQSGHGMAARWLARLHLWERAELLLEQSASNWSANKLVFLIVLGAAAGFCAGGTLRLGADPRLLAVLAAILFGVSPVLLLLQKRGRVLAQFDKQFPDALDFLARSMRAGHAFSAAMEMLAAEASDPLGRLFRRVSNDLALGSTLDQALSKMRVTLPSVDLQFFISSVLLQQETGGNLGEILTKLAQIMRERVRLRGQVRAVSAHGRITGLVLLLMPVTAVGFLMVTNPQYLSGMAADLRGRLLLYGAGCGQIAGYLVIRKIVNIKV